MRASSAQQTQTIARLESHNADLDRQLALSNAQEKTARASLRSAETRTKALREEMVRLKGTVAQIRGQCANDVRRRDGEIKRLKRHLEGRRSREGNGGQVGVVVITPGPPRSQQHPSGSADGCTDLASPEYSLKQETTDFLTQLSQGLSDENDALISLVRNTLTTLRSLQGLQLDSTQGPNYSPDHGGQGSANVMISAPPSYEELATDTDEVLEHLRGLLTNPSFVPLEEVEIREDEIIRLREGWEKMATRWKEAVAMIDGWRKRMLDTGDTINLDDLTRGMNLAAEIPAPGEDNGRSNIMVQDWKDLSNSENRKPRAVLESPTMPRVTQDRKLHDQSADNLPRDNILGDRSANARPSILPRKVSYANGYKEDELHPDEAKDMSLLDFSIFKPHPSPKRRSSPGPLHVGSRIIRHNICA